ncbi:MAG: 2-amino-4-hydroxy-6-hydroxymethyldihydropteridine diphosphokinase [Lactobacillales bacterium]|jgi:dihydroneopterin aldolase/2-amino-4-hydroxy-6-hydroxymethyldihydropteridine diphosphokinase|nr:2-amino-4-hydroxy-6-hydroxymethyldihydropteridine diphosphokinase [Lactobacillales bacterium]
MTDSIRIVNLETFGNHGVFPEENVLGQKFILSAELFVETREAGKTDDLTKSIHYGEVALEIDRFMRETTFKLIERVAEDLAEHLLLTFPLMNGIKLEIKKPWAPIGLPLDYASVQIERKWHTAYIALGSNIGNTEEYITEAIKQLGELKTSKVVQVSELIRTKPYGGVEQGDFLNGVLELKTLLTPTELLDELHKIEQSAGRERLVHWGPRTLDLDILLYDKEVVATPDLKIPHVDMQNRDFVLTPLAEIAPYAWHPLLNKSILQLQQELLAKN